MKKKKAGLILAALIAMGGVSAQAAITPDEQNQIVTAVLERLEKEKKISHYVSINGTDMAAGSNYDNKAATGEHAMVIGENSTATKRNGISIGANNRNEGYETTLVGTGNKAYGLEPGSYPWASNGTAIGYNNTILSTSGKLAAGSDNIVDNGMALGMGNEAMGQRSIAIGQSTHAYWTNTIAMGFAAKANDTDVIAMGSHAEGNAVGGVAIGERAIVKKDAGAGVAFGYRSVADRSGGVVGYIPGAAAQTSGEIAKYLGKEQEYAAWKAEREAKQDVYDKYKTWSAAVDADEAAEKELIDARIAYAKKPTDDNKKIIEEKWEAKKKTSEARGVAERKITEEDSKAYDSLNARYGQIFGKYISRSGAVSVGDTEKGITRQIINVAAGSEDTDAVNVAQLKDAVKSMKDSVTGGLESKVDADAGNLTDENVAAWQTKLGNGKNEAGNTGLVTGDTLNNALDGLNLDGNLANKADKNAGNLEDADKEAWRAALGGGTVAKGDKKFVDGDTVAAALESKVDADAENLTDENVAAWQTKLGNGKNEAGNTGLVTGDTLNNALDGLNLDGNLANKADKNAGNLEDADKEAWRAALGGGTVAKGDKKFVDGDTVAAALEDMGGQVTGKANTSLDNITDAGKTVIKDLAKGAVKVADGEHTTVRTEDKDGVVTYKVDVKADGKVAKDDKGIVTGGTVYAETRPEQDGKYVKKDNRAGQNFTALDMQVGKNAEDITKLGSTVYDMGMRVGELDSRMNKVGAGAAALAALHPQDFDPEDKWDFAAGYGHYKGANALAIGAFYRPDENKMISIGGSFGGGENMVSAGVSVKLGQGTGISTSKVAMANEIRELKEENREMKQEIEVLKEQMQKLLAGK